MNIDYAITIALVVQLNLGIGISISDYNFGKKVAKSETAIYRNFHIKT